ncbi:hypothetical protein JCM31826_04320 [Thermaurantimonas aggregans]|jgi:hypothetical protein|uniref:UVR domain-containing protein n=1 Tax=Thermaurantimonas aggregans TaxID=2173829 RepID=A0A401XIW6_9FLAO|nr:hypothetical protein [Thermaurantimonas aggregans]MCG9912062.1 hypothetical protein [Flavobacteriales bacterium]GCD76950.1 hypothetical protein JCM31826_04320 [Thermaurantimonas aggregans]
MEKDQIIEQLKIIRDKKEKAITAQSYEMASQLRDREKDLLKQLEEIEQNDNKHSR